MILGGKWTKMEVRKVNRLIVMHDRAVYVCTRDTVKTHFSAGIGPLACCVWTCAQALLGAHASWESRSGHAHVCAGLTQYAWIVEADPDMHETCVSMSFYQTLCVERVGVMAPCTARGNVSELAYCVAWARANMLCFVSVSCHAMLHERAQIYCVSWACIGMPYHMSMCWHCMSWVCPMTCRVERNGNVHLRMRTCPAISKCKDSLPRACCNMQHAYSIWPC